MPKKNEIILKSDCPNVSTKLLPLIKKFTSGGATTADIGMLLGYTQGNIGSWIKKIEKKYPELAEAWKTGVNLAEVALVAKAMQLAFGYDFDETAIRYKNVHKGFTSTGESITKEVPYGEKKVTKKHIKGDKDLLKFLLINRLPDYFADKKTIDVTKHVDIEAATEDEIRNFAGKLMETVDKRKVIESKEI
jgi:hypothetical protein